MEGEELNMPFLPDHLIERILAMVPFPQIFKTRALSKSWHSRLSSISSHNDEEKKLLAVSFQKLVCEVSDKWRTYSPIFLFYDFLVAYDKASQHWLKLPTLSSLLDRELMKVDDTNPGQRMKLSSMAGTLLLFTSGDRTLVVNILTRKWKQLPSCPVDESGRITFSPRLVSNTEMYKVIIMYREDGYVCAWIYDSKLGAWRRKTYDVPEEFDFGGFDVHLNGVLYVTINKQNRFWGFLAYHVEEEIFNVIQMLPYDGISVSEVVFCPLVTCNGNLYSVNPDGRTRVVDDFDGQRRSRVIQGPTLVEFDLGTRSWSKVIQGPPADLKFNWWSATASSDGHFLFFQCKRRKTRTSKAKASSDGHCLFIQGKRRQTRKSKGNVMVYDLLKDEWSYFAKIPIAKPSYMDYIGYMGFHTSFQPGMNPFLEV